MLTVLSLFDERSRPKGTRDPLGAEATWSFIGRKLVGNLTTVTSNLDNFMVALLCCRYASEQPGNPQEMQERFMRFEQLAAYLRCHSGRDSLLGITRTRTNLARLHNNELKALTLGRGSKAEILSNQISYGLWGLYSSALQLAGLLEPGERKLSARGIEFTDSLLAALEQEKAPWTALVAICQRSRLKLAEVEQLAVPFAHMLGRKPLRQQLVSQLLDGELASALQRELYALARSYLQQRGEPDVQAFCSWLLREETAASRELQAVVLAIQSVEPLLVLASSVTSWLQGKHECEQGELEQDLAPRLQNLQLREDWMQQASLPHREFLLKLHRCASAADVRGVMDTLLEHNRSIMAGRKGAPWLEWEGRRLKVRVRNDRALLPEQLDEASLGWHNSYFIGSFLAISAEAV